MTNYYEILEISEKASPEVIERVYKLLAKKYHPDLNPDNPKAAEEKFKKISEAYDILSDETKRKEYDAQLRAERVMKEQEAYARSAQSVPTNQMTQSPEVTEYDDMDFYDEQQDYKMSQFFHSRYYKKNNNMYDEMFKNMGIRFEPQKKSPKERILQLKSIGLTLLTFSFLLIIIWTIPFTRNKLINFYENNAPLKAFVDFLLNNNQDQDPNANNFLGVNSRK